VAFFRGSALPFSLPFWWCRGLQHLGLLYRSPRGGISLIRSSNIVRRVIQGADDEYGTPAQLDALAAKIARPVETLPVPDCKHSPHRDQPAATLAAMARFVARISKEPEKLPPCDPITLPASPAA